MEKLTDVFATPLIGAIFGFLGGWIGNRLSLRLKRADLIVHFHRQFDELQKKRVEILKDIARLKPLKAAGGKEEAIESNVEALKLDVKMYFDRFWSLQFDEFHAWYEGYVPTSLYAYWAWARWRQFRLDEFDANSEWSLEGVNLTKSAGSLRERWAVDTEQASHVAKFVNLMLTLKDSSPAPDMKVLLKRYGPTRRERVAALFHFGD